MIINCMYVGFRTLKLGHGNLSPTRSQMMNLYILQNMKVCNRVYNQTYQYNQSYNQSCNRIPVIRSLPSHCLPPFFDFNFFIFSIIYSSFSTIS